MNLIVAKLLTGQVEFESCEFAGIWESKPHVFENHCIQYIDQLYVDERLVLENLNIHLQ